MKWFLVTLKWSLVLLVGFLMGAGASHALSSMEKSAVWSNRWVVETDLKQSLEDYRKVNGRYPESLEVIKIPWLANEEDRRKVLLKPFYYENRGDTYILWWPRTEL